MPCFQYLSFGSKGWCSQEILTDGLLEEERVQRKVTKFPFPHFAGYVYWIALN